MVKAELPLQRRHENEPLRALKLTCINNLLSAAEERVYFKDLLSRFLFVSAGWLAAYAPDRSAADLVGKTDFEVFGKGYASAAFEDEQQIIRTGQPIVGKVERETYSGREDAWVSTTKMPLRDGRGQIIGTFGISRDVTAQVKAERALAHRARHDPLTGLANRASLLDRLSRALPAMQRRPSRLAVLCVGLDNFKQVNDCFGHDAGDLVLIEAGRRLSRLARRTDTVARLDGDEFALVCGGLDDQADVRLLGERIIRAIDAPMVGKGLNLSITCSVGITVTREVVADPDRLVRDADLAMQEAKQAGRHRCQLYHQARDADSEPNLLHSQLSRAIEEAELFLLYQPVFALEARVPTGVEALVRWRHPERGIVQPYEFIPFAEEHGLIGRVDSFLLNEACRQLAEWSARDGWPSAFSMAVNISGRELADPRLAGRVAEAARRHGIDPARLCLEITETALIGEVGDVQRTLARLGAIGVRIALDDFGTGYSTLAQLQRLRADVVKIDRTFVEQISRSARDREIVAAVIAMTHALGMTVVGEGIETSHQLQTLTALGCDEGQGRFFARPLPPDSIVALVGGDRRAGQDAAQGRQKDRSRDLPASVTMSRAFARH
jgi:diguanylate cyclase (GGDEF)-like protein